MQEQTLSVCVCGLLTSLRFCARILQDREAGSGRSPLNSLWRVTFSYPIACYKTLPDLSAVIIAKYKGLFWLNLERSLNQFIHWNWNLGGIIFTVRSGP